MNTLLLKGDKFILNNEEFNIDDLYTEDFLRESDRNAEKFFFQSYFVNEIFLNTFQPFLALQVFIGKNHITNVKFEKPDVILYALIKDLSKKCSFKLEEKEDKYFHLKAKIRLYYYIVITTLYLIYRMMRISKIKKQDDSFEEFIIIRTNSAKKKFQKFNYPKYYEDISDKYSLYSRYSIIRRLFWVTKSLFESFSQLKKISSVIEESLGKFSVIIPFEFYEKRIVHTLLYENLLDAFFKECEFKTLYTGNNLDRFSMIEETIAKKYQIKTICIPHGIEYGFRFPKVFTCDVFYTTTKNAETHLNTIYQTNKFVFDQHIAHMMFNLSKENRTTEKRVVFFTEPREINVNIAIIDYLTLKLKIENISLFVKLHPKDSKQNYSNSGIIFLDSLEDSLIGNVCISRKSTTLLECIYNDSQAAAILTNSKDKTLFSTFPSLQIADIFVTEDYDSLLKWILNNINK